MSSPSTPIKRYALVLFVVWTLLVACSFVWTYSQQKINTLEIARSEARIAFQKDTLYRKWAAKHGGVFVPATPESPPNPYLPKIIERDITTPSGKALTLVNPAYMTRQVFEMANQSKDLARGHITSLNPIRPENAPDPWERDVLGTFEKGGNEVSEVQAIEGQQYLRLMRPFITEQSCLKCHAAQGYKVGDIRGGISVSVPLRILSNYSDRIIAGTAAAHGMIWIMGIGMIGLGSRKLAGSATALYEKNLMLEEEIAERQIAQEQLQEQAAMLEDEIGERQMAQESLQEQAVMLEEEITERAQAEAAIIQSEEKFSRSFQNAPLMMAITKIEDGTFLDINNKFVELSGYQREDVIGKTSLELGWISAADRSCIVDKCQRNGRVSGMDLTVRTKDGVQISTLYYGELFPIDGQTAFLSICLDVTEQRRIEAQLLHAQKMEAIGTLAGGVAHDFNNVLTVISGYATLLSARLAAGSKEAGMADEISASVERAAEMTSSLLAFSRKEPMSLKPENMNTIISALEKSLKRLIREDIEFKCALSDLPTPVMADKGQLEQVLVNLVVNARDAMPAGGTLSLTSSITSSGNGEIGLDEESQPGTYCLLTVSDTGFGMDRETRDRIFEPFFTTKETNKGTGLGLSIVHGIIAKHQGKIHVCSEQGQGTTFRIYLPLMEQSQQKILPEQWSTESPGGNETLLLADDDEAVRRITSLILKNSGYTVLLADNGEAALSRFHDNHETIKLLITDVIMPRKSGKELCGEIRQLKADLPAIFISGYTGEIMETQGALYDNTTFLSKPVKPEALLSAVRKMLDADKTP